MDAADRPICQHCRERIAARPRGLCDACYRTPSVRYVYAAQVTTFDRRGPGAAYRNAPLPDRPTSAPPGTAAKVAVLEQRVESGSALFHPQDAGAA